MNIIKCALQAGGIGLWKCWFLWRQENRISKDENQQQTQPTYDTGTGNRTRTTRGVQ